MEVDQRATGKSSIKNLFLENPSEEDMETEPAMAEHQNALDHASKSWTRTRQSRIPTIRFIKVMARRL